MSRPAAVFHQLQRFHHLRQAMQAEVTGLDGDDHFIAGFERVEGNETHAGRAVDDRPLIGAVGGGKRLGQAVFATGPAGEDLLERRQLDVAGREIEIAGDLPDHFGNLRGFAVGVFDQGIEDGAFDLSSGTASPTPQ